MPICCVDIVIRDNGYYLLIRRTQEPAKGKYWFPGGRLLKNESLESAAVRKVKEELDIDIKLIKQVGVYQTFFDKSEYGCNTHTINIAFLAKPMYNDYEIKSDGSFDKVIFTSNFDGSYDDYILKIIKDIRDG